MASGSELSLKLGGVYSAIGNTATTACVVSKRGAGNPINWGRIQVVWLNSTTATFTAWPTNWTKFYDQTIGTMRCGIFWTNCAETQAADGADTSNYTFTCSASSMYVSNGQSWDNIEGLSLGTGGGGVGGAATITGTTGATIVVPAFTLPGDGWMPIWFVAAKYSANGTSGTIAPPADLQPCGAATPTNIQGMGGRCGGWVTGSGNNERGYRSPVSVPAKTFTLTNGTRTAVSAIGFAVKAADRGFLMAAA
jgi:hypothetical protein